MLKLLVIVVVLGVVAASVVLAVLRWRHDAAVDALWLTLERSAVGGGGFDPASVAGLPAPARRMLLHALAPGTPLAGAVLFEAEGQIGLQPGAEKLPFRARQILTVDGLIWRARVGRGLMRMSGSDRYAAGREGGMRWFLWYGVPLVRAEDPDVLRSAAGRVALEIPFFLPTVLAMADRARWEAVDDTSARVHVRVGDEEFAPLLTVGPQGRLTRIQMDRWDPEAVDGRPGHIPWAADEFADERTFDGVTIPTTAAVTRRAGTPQADTFFLARITSARYR